MKESEQKKRIPRRRLPLRSPQFDLHPRTRNWIAGILVAAAALLVVLSLSGSAGPAGRLLARALEAGFGWGAWLVPLLCLGAAWNTIVVQRKISGGTFAGAALFFFAALSLFSMTGDAEALRGGFLGKWMALLVERAFGGTAAALLFIVLGVVGGFIFFNYPADRGASPSFPSISLRRGDRSRAPELESDDGAERRSASVRMPSFRIRRIERSPAGIAPEEGSPVASVDMSPKEQEESFAAVDIPRTPYAAPSLELLDGDRGNPRAGDVRANMGIIKRAFANFGIPVEMGEVTVGPTVTQYTLKPAEGVKLAKLRSLDNDLALALAAHPIRIEAPIPGRSLVGIEVPNEQVSLVRLRNLLQERDYRESPHRLSFALGRDVAGGPRFAALEKMPHLLIAGATGTGKTIALNSVVLSLLYRNSPSFLRFLLIDPKRVEFPVFNGIPHLLTPVVVDVEKTVHALRWAVHEMERRFDLLSQAHARDIGVYNRTLKRNDEPMPYLVIVIDELADIMAARGREAEAAIVRIAQMARAVGIHLVVATQRPSVEVITGLIKANITSRMAFQVASQVDSRTILDGAGAEKLLGNGDMLFVSAEISKPRRIQGAFASEKEVKRVAEFLKGAGAPTYEAGITEPREGEEGEWFGEGGGLDDDPLYGEAKRLVIQMRKASASYLQRRLRVGYARAARLIDLLEERGVVGPGDGAKPRDVLIGTGGEETQRASDGEWDA